MTTAAKPWQEKAHALLGASSAEIWINCTPAPRLCETLPESQSNYADEGNLAHDIAELKLKKALVEPMGPKKFKQALDEFKKHPLYQDEMLQHTDTYLEYISKIVHGFKTLPYVAVEKRVFYDQWAPEGVGTADNIIIGGGTLFVNDFKYGKGVQKYASYTEYDANGSPAVKGNPQMMLYALGAWAAYSTLARIERVRMAIIQPRLDHISEWEIGTTDLLAWGEWLKPIALKAFQGEGEFKPGEWCRFCRAKSLCRARSEFSLTAINTNAGKLPPVLSNEEIGAILTQIEALGVEKWIKDLGEYALSESLKGNEIPGWKAVEGRGRRAYADVDGAIKALTGAGYDEALLYDREPKSPAEMEKLVGKKTFKDVLTPFIHTPPGKPTLVPAADKRDAISSRTTAAEDFGTPPISEGA